MRTGAFFSVAAALLLLQIAIAADAPAAEPAASPAPSPEAVKQALSSELAAIGVPTADLAGKVVPGANPVQINSVLTTILNAKATAAFQQETAENNQDAQAVLAALANPASVPALSPSAKTQYDAVLNLFKQPDFANAPASTTATTGRKLLMAHA